MTAKRETKIAKTDFRHAIKEESGNISAIARRLNVPRQTIYNYLDRWNLREELQRAKANIITAAEDSIYDAVLDGDTDAARFVLTHHPRNTERWTSKTEVTVGGLKLSPETMALLENLGIDLVDVAAEFEALIQSYAINAEG